MLIAKNLECQRNGQQVFSNLNFQLHAGEVMHVVGANGCGKSSLLQMLCGLLPIASGQINWQGMDINQSESAYYQQINYLGHRIGVKTGLTVLENLKVYAKLAITPEMKTREYDFFLQQLCITSLKNKLCQQLSAGQRQRVALTRLLLSSAQLWILDEPFTAIDKDGINSLQKLMVKHLSQGGMIIFTNHNLLDWDDLPVKYLNLSS